MNYSITLFCIDQVIETLCPDGMTETPNRYGFFF
jgi:hypothetical protein